MPNVYNYFQDLKEPSYEEMEVSDLKDIYDRINDPLSDEISKLLESTYNFLCATTLNSFKEMRDRSNTNDDLLEVLNEAGESLETAKKQLPKATLKPLLEDAILYSREVMQKRLNRLQEANDRIYDLYIKEDNILKIFLTAPLK